MAIETVLAAAGLGLSGVSALSTFQQGQYAKEAANRQAQVLNQQSKYVAQQAGLKMSKDDYEAIGLIARIKTGAAASGINPETGSPGQLVETSAQQARINDMFTKYSANIEEANLQYQATLEKSVGEQQAEAATISAGTGLISSGIRAYGAYEGDVDPYSQFLTLPSGP